MSLRRRAEREGRHGDEEVKEEAAERGGGSLHQCKVCRLSVYTSESQTLDRIRIPTLNDNWQKGNEPLTVRLLRRAESNPPPTLSPPRRKEELLRFLAMRFTQKKRISKAAEGLRHGIRECISVIAAARVMPASDLSFCVFGEGGSNAANSASVISFPPFRSASATV